MDSVAPPTIEGTWRGESSDGTQISVTFLENVKGSDSATSKLCITFPDLIVYTSGNYTYTNGYASMKFINSLSSSQPEFLATMIYEANGQFTFTTSYLNREFVMTKLP